MLSQGALRCHRQPGPGTGLRRVWRDPRVQGFGFVTFKDEESMKDAIKGKNGKTLGDRNIIVKEVGSGSYKGRVYRHEDRYDGNNVRYSLGDRGCRKKCVYPLKFYR